MDIRGLLPREVAQGEFGTGWYYERFSPFTWEWSARRTLLLGAVAVPFGAMLGVIHGLYAHDAAQGVAVGCRAALAGGLAVALGPALGAVVRARGWPLTVERAGVVLAVVVGVLVAYGVRVWAEEFHDHLMGTRMSAVRRLVWLVSGRWPLHAVVENATNLAAALMLHAIAGGALALRPYFAEPRRWREHVARRELEALRQAKATAESRLAVLQAQVEPHFLFNTLATVSAEVEADPRRARALIEALAAYLRSTLPRLRPDSALSSSTLAEQFELCGRYLEVIAIRQGGRLHVSRELPPALGARRFPPLLLLSLVENAVTHGIEPKRGHAHIALHASLDEVDGERFVEVVVRDDGVGFSEGLVEGTGIANVRAQLEALFGPEARLTVESPPEGGVRAAIVVPDRLLQS